ncbi:MAG TPA: alpha/beta fold hydrolase [Acidimicrobiales bacterium]|nr:alpha/beta fold hydrolase [Acidimicrobiales bacterium]
MSSAVLPGAEPGSWAGGPDGALVLHGFTGNPQSVRGLAAVLARAGLAVELPLLPGHGTAVADLVPTRWDDWAEAAEAAWAELAGRCRRTVVAGLSMGGTLACWLATRHPEVAGVVAVNPLVEPPAESYLDILRGLLDSGVEVAPGIGSDIADPDGTESAYEGTPVRAALSLFGATGALVETLDRLTCPVLLLSSGEDHVVPSSSGDLLCRLASGPVERVWLERSYHVATLDFDRHELEQRAASFAQRVLGADLGTDGGEPLPSAEAR